MRNETVETIEYKGYKINIYQDENPESPREWDNFTQMICFHKDYDLGDKHTFSKEELLNLVMKSKDIIALPLYLYDHSGITMNTGGFSCQWDSGQVGYIYVTFETIKKEYSIKKVSKKLIEKIKKLMIAEVEEYDNYITGSIYGYMIDTPEGETGGCWGYYGYDHEKSSLLESAKDEIEGMIEERKSIVDNIAVQVI